MDALTRTLQWGDKVSGWGIAETAPEIEKIKAESADYLHGLNSCGEIPWEVYDYAFDFYAELIQKAYELGKSEALPHWIPVEQELPEYGKAVLTITQDETYEVNHVIDEECGEWFWEDNGKVIAWCELPEPFKGVTT